MRLCLLARGVKLQFFASGLDLEFRGGVYPGIALLFLLPALLLSPGAAYAAGDAGQLGDVYDLGLGVHSQGMGNAVVGMGTDMSTVYWNPAGMPSVPYSGVTTSYRSMFVETENNTYSFLWRGSGNWALGGSYLSLTSGGFEAYGSDGDYLGDFSVTENSYRMAFAYEFHPLFSVGLAGKQFNQQVWSWKDSRQSFDLGLFSRLTPDWRLGASFRNIGASGGKTDQQLPMTYRLGSSLWFWERQIRFAADVEKVEGRDETFHYGVEFVDERSWPFQRTLSARGGVDDGRLTLGVSLSVDRNWRFDFSLADHEIELLNQFAISYRWDVEEGPVDDRREESKIDVQGEYPNLPDVLLDESRSEINTPSIVRRLDELLNSDKSVKKLGESVNSGGTTAGIEAVGKQNKRELGYSVRTVDTKPYSPAEFTEAPEETAPQEPASGESTQENEVVETAVETKSGTEPEEKSETEPEVKTETETVGSEPGQIVRLEELRARARRAINNGEFERAASALDEAQQLAPESSEVEKLRNQLDRAIEMVSYQNAEAREHYEKGLDAYAADDYEKAVQHLKQALEIDSDLEEARKALERIRNLMNN